MANANEQFDRPYRRGLVLGLSLAEIFLILLFLLLVATMNILVEAENAQARYESEIDRLIAIELELKAAGGKIEDIDFDELFKAMETARKLQSEVDQLKALEPYSKIDEALIAKGPDLETTQRVREDIKNLIDKTPIDNLHDALNPTMDVENLRDEKRKLADRLDALLVEKGEVPPCWFEKRDSLKDPEKEIKIFDIQMSDDELIVMRRAEVAEKINLPLETDNFGNLLGLPEYPQDSLGKKISYDQFMRSFKQFFVAGDEKKIQSYRCRFFVYLWDNTTTKENYKKRLGVIESIFYRFSHKDNTPWPYTNVGQNFIRIKAEESDQTATVNPIDLINGTETNASITGAPSKKKKCAKFNPFCKKNE